MPRKEPTTQRMSATDARQHFAETINQVAREGTQIVVEKNGAPVVAIVSIDDLMRYRSLEMQDAETAALFERMSEPFRDVPIEEFEAEVEKIMKELREEDRQNRRNAATGA